MYRASYIRKIFSWGFPFKTVYVITTSPDGGRERWGRVRERERERGRERGRERELSLIHI